MQSLKVDDKSGQYLVNARDHYSPAPPVLPREPLHLLGVVPGQDLAQDQAALVPTVGQAHLWTLGEVDTVTKGPAI